MAGDLAARSSSLQVQGSCVGGGSWSLERCTYGVHNYTFTQCSNTMQPRVTTAQEPQRVQREHMGMGTSTLAIVINPVTKGPMRACSAHRSKDMWHTPNKRTSGSSCHTSRMKCTPWTPELWPCGCAGSHSAASASAVQHVTAMCAMHGGVGAWRWCVWHHAMAGSKPQHEQHGTVDAGNLLFV